ncbi:hypothetical protein PRIPAC_88927 [Pristionchus pacificus]|uniref:Serpentine receptor class gamma n=1 Tax=Pristionchus pacificus TaxID=54126 RepID=A0A2A6CXT6_PRIPA|nr:hypothetical protein PRIPAC_88927 [Pristionchus pacificus]|eukprot:PDM83032.1 G protein-coupled receptor [Pristionchus pacificus]
MPYFQHTSAFSNELRMLLSRAGIIGTAMMFRVTYWIAPLIILIVSTVVHIRLLAVVIVNRKQVQYSSFFFKMFISQSIIEIFLAYAYVICEMILKDLLFGEEFALATGYVYPTIAYYGCYYYIIHVQVWGVVMVSINRCVTICAPFSRLAKLYERAPPAVLWILNLVVPLLMMFWMPSQGAVNYYRNPSGAISLNVPLYTVQTNSMQGMITSVTGSVVKAGSDYRREKMLTVVGFALFVALCFSTVFYVLLYVNAIQVNVPVIITVRTYYIYAIMALTFVNPWMLLLTNKNTRRRMLFQKSDVSSQLGVPSKQAFRKVTN